MKSGQFLLLVLSIVFLESNSLLGINCESYSIPSQGKMVSFIDSLIDDSFDSRRGEIHKIKENTDWIECISKRYDYKKGIASAYLDRGLYLYYVSDMEKAIETLNYSLDLSHSNKFAEIEANSNNFLGLIYHDLGEYEIALSYQFAFFQLAKNIKNEKWQGEALGNIANIHYKFQHYEEALEYHKNSNEIFVNVPDFTINKGWSNLHYGEIYGKLGFRQKALTFFEKAIQSWEAADMLRGLGYTYGSMGDFFYPISIEKSEFYYQKGLKISEKLGNLEQITSIKLGLARLFYEQRKIEEALLINHQVIELCNDNSIFSERGEEATQLIIDYFLKEANTEKIAEYKQYLFKFRAENLERKKRVLAIRVAHENRANKKKEEHFFLKEKLLVSQQKFFFQKVIMAVGFFVTLCISLMAYMQFKKKKERELLNIKLQIANDQIKKELQINEEQKATLLKMNTQIQNQNQKLEFNLAEKILIIAHENEMLQETMQLIKSGKTPVAEKKQLIKVIQSHQRENIWDSVDLQFSKMHKELYEKLTAQSSTITSQELRLSALIKMQLTSKEIARILYKSPESIRMAKSRLRKKLEMKDSTEFINFLNSL